MHSITFPFSKQQISTKVNFSAQKMKRIFALCNKDFIKETAVQISIYNEVINTLVLPRFLQIYKAKKVIIFLRDVFIRFWMGKNF